MRDPGFVGRPRASRQARSDDFGAVLRIRVAVVALLAAQAVPVAAQLRPRWEAPTLTTVRYDESWDRYADPDERTDWIAKLKYIPLDGDGDHLTTGLEVRERVESYNNDEAEGGARADQSYLLSRFLPYADLHIANVRAFVQPMVTVVSGGSERPSVDRSGVDVLQAFVDVDLAASDDRLVLFRAGREMVSLGRERLVGTRYGINTPRSFDGARAIWVTPVSQITVLYLRPVDLGFHSLDDRTSRSQQLWGAYGTRTFPKRGDGIDLYYLGFANDQAVFANAAGRERRHTVGARYFGRTALLHWDLEALYQFGRIEGRRISAYGVGISVGHEFTSSKLKPDITIQADVVSGDRRKGSFGTVNALYPNGGYFGELTPFGPYNLMNINPALAFVVAEGVKFGVSGQAYWRHRREDGLYNVPGIVLRLPEGSRARFVGTQVEAVVQWQATRQLGIEASVSHFQSGTFLRETGSGRNIRLLAAEANYRF